MKPPALLKFIKSKHRSKTKKWTVALGTGAIVTALLLLLIPAGQNLGALEIGSPVAPHRSVSAGTAAISQSPLLEALMKLRRGLGRDLSMKDTAAALSELQDALHASPPGGAVTALLAMLDSGDDAKTGLVFRVGPGGDLLAAPTLRVWMLDQLGRLDPNSAANYAAHIYARHDSADEWAVALRNDWRVAGPTGHLEGVRARALELLADTEWAKQPSLGFLEALDVSVATMAWEAVPRFEQWLDPAQPHALRAGAWVALDRLTMEGPSDFLPTLVQHREWLASQPLLRAGFIARADLSVERERSAVETYLQRDDVVKTEGRRFFELIPNVNSTISHNLVTKLRMRSPSQAARLDRVSLAAIREWYVQPRFSRWTIELAEAESRLAESVASAIRGGLLPP